MKYYKVTEDICTYCLKVEDNKIVQFVKVMDDYITVDNESIELFEDYDDGEEISEKEYIKLVLNI